MYRLSRTSKLSLIASALALLGSPHPGTCAVGGRGSSTIAAASQVNRFQGHHEASIHDIPAGAHRARIWLVLPREDPAQKISDIRLSGPGKSSIAQGGTYHNRYAYFEVQNPGSTLTVAADFAIERREVNIVLDRHSAQPLSDRAPRRFRSELQANTYVPVGGKYETLAGQIVGDEQNPVLQAKRLYDWVLTHVEYWVKDPQHLKPSANGESEYCLTNRTGNCSDFHSLYSSLARSIGIPTRMVYGSLFQAANSPVPNKPSLDGKDTDASYHCWVEFFADGPGWVPLDVALANLLPGHEQQEWYFGNLDARRVTWSMGRDLILAPKQDAGPVNAMAKVYVEIDGKPHTAWERKFTYRSLPTQSAARM